MQDMRIRKKTRQTVRPLPGSLFRAKTSGATRIRLKDAAALRPPAKYTQKQVYEYGVHRHVCNITSETAEAFRFRLELFFNRDAFTDESSIQLADGGRLIPSKDGTAGKEQFCRSAIAKLGCVRPSFGLCTMTDTCLEVQRVELSAI